MSYSERGLPRQGDNSRSEKVVFKVNENPQEQNKEFETEGFKDQEAILRALTTFDEVAQHANTPEQKEEIFGLREKIAKAAWKICRLGRNASMIGMLGLGVGDYINHEITHPDLTVNTDGHGNKEYVHPDAETTHILNVLAGKESFSLEESLKNFRDLMRARADLWGIQLPEDYETYDIDRLEEFFIPAFAVKGIKMKRGEFKDFFYTTQYLEKTDVPSERVEETYELVWQLEQECGNPKVRFQNEKAFGLGDANQFSRPHFDGLTNTIYIPLENFIHEHPRFGSGYENIIAELSHAKQLQETPIAFQWGVVSSAIRVFLHDGFEVKKWKGTYDKGEYATPGTVEYEAHQIIEPQLKGKYKGLLDIKGIKGKSNDETH